MDVRAGIDILKRRRIVIGAVGAAVLTAGILYWAGHRAMPSATAQVLLPSGTATDRSPGTITQEAIATSPSVLGPATTAVSPGISESLLREQIKVTAEGSDVLRITVKNPHPADAVKLADAVAKAYIAVSPEYFAAGQQAQLTNNQVQEAAYQSRIQDVTDELKQVGTTSAAGAIDQTELQNLETALAQDEANDEILRGQISANTPTLLQAATTVN